VELSTPVGAAIQVKANLTELVPPGVAQVYHNLPGADINLLLPGDYLDPISGFPGYKSLICAVKKIAPAAAGAQGVTR
jgi:hypothetical protein